MPYFGRDLTGISYVELASRDAQRSRDLFSRCLAVLRSRFLLNIRRLGNANVKTAAD